MKATKLLHDVGQSIWLDNITRDLLERGTLGHYVVKSWKDLMAVIASKSAVLNEPALRKAGG